MTRQEIYRGFLDTFATGKYPFEASNAKLNFLMTELTNVMI